jgi:transposase
MGRCCRKRARLRRRFLLIEISRRFGDDGRQDRDQGQLFYEFKLDKVVPKNHLLRRMNVFVTGALADLHEQLKPEIGRPSVDPELMIWMLIVGYCYGIRSEGSCAKR